MFKICKACNKNKRTSSFYIAYKYKDTITYSPTCKECDKIRSATWRRNNKDKRFWIDIKHHYGLTKEQYLKMFEEQKGQCAICPTKQSEHRTKLNIDHCHKTGKVRGLLCHKCNILLGKANDDAEILRKAIRYLELSK